MSSAEIIQKIVRYRQFLERALGKREDQQVLVILEKLDRLPISLDHLQETGIGKAVNCYRKCSDPVGQKAKSIVNKWKGLVQAAIAEDQSQRSDNSPVPSDDESEHLSHSNATDDDEISTHDSFENDSPVIHKEKERSANRGRPSEMEAYSSKVKRKLEDSRVEKPSKKPYDNSGGLEQRGSDRSAKTDSREMAHQLKESLPCNGSSKDGKCSDISSKAVSYQSHLNSSGKSQVSTNRNSSRGSDHSSSHRGHKSESQKGGSSSHSNRDVSHGHRSNETDGKSSTSVSRHDSLRKNTNIVSDSESLSQNRTIVEALSSEQNQGSGDVCGKNPRHFDLANNLKRRTNDSSYGDVPQKKQLLESETTAIITDLHDGPSPQDYGKSAPSKQSGHRGEQSSHRNSSSKTNSSSHRDHALPKQDSAAHLSKEKRESESKSSCDKFSVSREVPSSKESLSGRHQSHKESASKNSSQKEMSAKASSHAESSSKHVSHKDSGSRTSSAKESSSKHSSQKQSSSLPPVFKESSRKVSDEKLTPLEESFSESFPDDTVTKPSFSGKLAGSSVKDSPRSVHDSLRAEMGVTETKGKPAAVTFAAFNSDAEEDSCGMSFEEMLSYDISLSRLGSATKPAPRKTAVDMGKVLKKDDGRIAKGYSGSPSSVLSDSNKPINEKDSVGRKVSKAEESSSKKNDNSSKYEDGSRVSGRDSSKVNSSHHYKLESSSSTKHDQSGGSHSKSDGSSSKERIKSSGAVQKSEDVGKQEHSKSSSSKTRSESHSSKESSKSNSSHSKSVSNKEHSIYSSSHSKSESKSSKEISKSSSSHHQKLETSSIKEASKSGSSSRRPECSKTSSSGDDSRDKNSQIVQPKKETKEFGYGSGSSSTKDIRNLVDESDGDSEDIDNNGKSFEDFLNYKPSQNKSLAKSSKLYSAGSRDKLERKPLGYNTDCGDGLSLSHPLVNVPLPKQEELNLSLESDGLPLYPFMQPDSQVKKDSVEKLANLERRYNQKMIYSGKKTATVPTAMTSLFAACMQVLQENIDDITFVGGIPADILKPVLELCSVSQLERLEFYNPQFVGDTEDLWKLHCNRDFRGRDPEELESWRELYLRLQDARNKRLATISQSVMANKKRAEKDVPRIQLTYVDHSLCTGRRTSKKLAAVRTSSSAATASDETSQPRSKQEILDSLKSQVSKPMIRRRGGGYRPEVTSISKPAAPLMQKTLKFLKGMKR